MTIEEAAVIGQGALLAALTICGPMLLAALVVGLSVSLFQSVTQINEMTLVFVPKITAVFLVLLMMGGWMIDRAVEYTTLSIQSVSIITQ